MSASDMPFRQSSLPVALGRALSVVPVLLATVLAPAAVAAPQARAGCAAVALPVSHRPGAGVAHQIAGQLCAPRTGHSRTVQLLLHGATYGRDYWDPPSLPVGQSHTVAANAAGTSTLAIDRIGSGASSHPDPAEVDTPANLHVLRQVVHGLRGGRFGATFTRVVLVGHSYGAVLATGLAAEPGLVDGLVVTGLIHRFDTGFNDFLATLGPARDQGGRFASLAPGYLTTRPNVRSMMYHSAQAAPATVSAYEARLKQTFTNAEGTTAGPALQASKSVKVPVLLMIGSRDRLFCTATPCSASDGAGLQAERAQWTTGDYQQLVVADTGHSLALHRNASSGFAAINRWVRQRFPG